MIKHCNDSSVDVIGLRDFAILSLDGKLDCQGIEMLLRLGFNPDVCPYDTIRLSMSAPVIQV